MKDLFYLKIENIRGLHSVRNIISRIQFGIQYSLQQCHIYLDSDSF